MPIRRPPLANGEIYHVMIRAVEGLRLFRDRKDYLRMVHDLFEFNDEAPTDWHFRKYIPRTVLGISEVGRKRKRELLVEILMFCLMPNHVHLSLRQVQEGGISKFMRKIGAGYGLYYNSRYKRKGHVFQGKYQIVHIRTEEQLRIVFVYIHTNPVSLIVPNWKEKGIRAKDLKRVIKFLENYRWSSYPDYLGRENFPSLTSREFLNEIMMGPKGCREFVNDWLRVKKELTDFEQIALE